MDRLFNIAWEKDFSDGNHFTFLLSRRVSHLFQKVQDLLNFRVVISAVPVPLHQNSVVLFQPVGIRVQQFDAPSSSNGNSAGEVLASREAQLGVGRLLSPFSENSAAIETLDQNGGESVSNSWFRLIEQYICELNRWRFRIQDQSVSDLFFDCGEGFIFGKISESVAGLQQSVGRFWPFFARIVLHCLAVLFGLFAEACGARYAAGFPQSYTSQNLPVGIGVLGLLPVEAFAK